MSTLNHKLRRDLWRMKGQVVAIGIVIAIGVSMLVMMSGLVMSLDETRLAYYERYRLADVFVPVARAPERLLAALARIPGVATAEGRVVGDALVDLEKLKLPVRARVVSLPESGQQGLNDIYLTEGRRVQRGRSDEIVLLRGFAQAHALQVGDRLRATMNGARYNFRIVGLAQAPEFLYATAPGELVSDESRFGVIWMGRPALAAVFDLEGAFNEALLSLGRHGGSSAVIAAADRLLEKYGRLGAYDVADQYSNRLISEEIEGLHAISSSVPPVFLAVAAFLLYIVVSRMVNAEREEIGLMKAFGYTGYEVSSHYLKLIVFIAAGGAMAGCLLGIFAGRAMADYYLVYFKFPFLVFQLDPAAFVIGIIVSILAASAGGLLVLRGVFRLTPAVAMNPPAPPDYSRAGRVGAMLDALLDQPSRMVLRRLIRQPGRMLGATLGIAAGMALSAAMISIVSSYNLILDLSYTVMDRSDVAVTFVEPKSKKTIFELRALPGVVEAEPVRVVQALLRNGPHSYRGAVNGLPDKPRLNRAVDSDTRAIDMPGQGIVLGRALAGILRISPGEVLTVEVREGRQPVLRIPVAGIAETLLGSPAYMRIEALNRALHEPNRVSGAYLRIDLSAEDSIYRALKGMPAVAGVSLKSDTRGALQKLMDEGAGAMRYIMVLVAASITFAIVYNAARIAQAERQRDIASLRVLGFTRSEAGFVLLGELAVVTLLALPLGTVLGFYLSFVVSAGFSSEIYQIPAHFDPASYGFAALAVLSAALGSGVLVKRDIDRADLVSALKTRE